jgi:hypothetical protein
MSEQPVVAWAKPSDKRVAWQFYADGKIKVRELNNGTVQFAVGDETEWRDA